MSKEAIAIKALEVLARLGNGDQYGNSTGNTIARTALAEISRLAEQPVPVQEPLGYVHLEEVQMLSLVDALRARLSKMPDWPCTQPIYTTPPAAQRTWVDLTDEEIQNCYGGNVDDFARALLAKSKERNT